MTSEHRAQSAHDEKHGICAQDAQSLHDRQQGIHARGAQPVQGGRAKVLPHILKISAGIVMAAAFFITALLSSTELVAYGIPGYFQHEFKKYDVYSDLPMSEAETDRVMSETMDYLRGDRERLDDVTADIDGIGETAFYNADEVSHMADVRVMFIGGLRLRNILAALLVVCAVTLAAVRRAELRREKTCGIDNMVREPGRRDAQSHTDGKRHPESGNHAGAMRKAGGSRIGTADRRSAGPRDTVSCVLRAFAVTELVMIAACAATALYASTDFTSFFTRFHEIFFPQGNWEFDPTVSRMINMLPEGLFSDTAMYIVTAFAVIEVIAIVAAWRASRRGEKAIHAA